MTTNPSATLPSATCRDRCRHLTKLFFLLNEVCRLLFWLLRNASGRRRCHIGWGRALQKEQFGLRLLVKSDRGCRRTESTLYNHYASPGRLYLLSDDDILDPMHAATWSLSHSKSNAHTFRYNDAVLESSGARIPCEGTSGTAVTLPK